MKQVLILCNHNVERGPELEYYLAGPLRQTANVISAAIDPDKGTGRAKSEMPTTFHGDDFAKFMEKRQKRSLSEEDVAKSDVILVHTEDQRETVIQRHPKADGKTFLVKELLPKTHPFVGNSMNAYSYGKNTDEKRKTLGEITPLIARKIENQFRQ